VWKILLSFRLFLVRVSILHRTGNVYFFLKVCNFKDFRPFKFQPQQVPDNLKVHTLKVKEGAWHIDVLLSGDSVNSGRLYVAPAAYMSVVTSHNNRRSVTTGVLCGSALCSLLHSWAVNTSLQQ
jgi:hypothetical protein